MFYYTEVWTRCRTKRQVNIITEGLRGLGAKKKGYKKGLGYTTLAIGWLDRLTIFFLSSPFFFFLFLLVEILGLKVCSQSRVAICTKNFCLQTVFSRIYIHFLVFSYIYIYIYLRFLIFVWERDSSTYISTANIFLAWRNSPHGEIEACTIEEFRLYGYILFGKQRISICCSKDFAQVFVYRYTQTE